VFEYLLFYFPGYVVAPLATLVSSEAAGHR